VLFLGDNSTESFTWQVGFGAHWIGFRLSSGWQVDKAVDYQGQSTAEGNPDAPGEKTVPSNRRQKKK
jgi:hypothetical protein